MYGYGSEDSLALGDSFDVAGMSVPGEGEPRHGCQQTATLVPGFAWLNCVRDVQWGEASTRTAEVGVHFGLGQGSQRLRLVGPVRVSLSPGRLVFICGPSGSGKSAALQMLREQYPAATRVEDVEFAPRSAVIDGIAPWAELGEAIRILTACGLGDAQMWLRRFEELSEGEKFRARLARAVAQQCGRVPSPPLLCDEFCSLLDGRAARAISFALRKLVTRKRLCLVVASVHADLADDLQPDSVLRLQGRGRWEFDERTPSMPRPVSFLRRLHVQTGSKRDYDEFAGMHYRSSEDLGFVDKVFLLRESVAGDVLGIAVYAHSPLELSLRNQATDGYFSRHARRVNRHLRILRRLVIDPDVRGCGLGQYLVRKTLPRCGTQYVECLSAMGEFNPVLERAGMRRVGQCEISPERQAALDELSTLRIDVFGPEFALHVGRDHRVRRVVTEVVTQWYAATTGGGRRRVEHQPGHVLARTFQSLASSRPVYYLWRRPSGS